MNCTPYLLLSRSPQSPSPQAKEGGIGRAWAKRVSLMGRWLHSPLSPHSLKEEIVPQRCHLTGAVNVKFKFILCTTFDFKADYTSVVKGGHSSGPEQPPGSLLGPEALLTPSNSLGLILVMLSKGPGHTSAQHHMCHCTLHPIIQ